MKTHKVTRTYSVWSNTDPNDCFEIEVGRSDDPAQVALSEVGYSVSAEPVEYENR